MLTKPYPPNPASKSGRSYGAVWSAVRALRNRKFGFTWKDVVAEGVAPVSAAKALRQMARRGELRLVRQGTPGPKGQPSIYTFIPPTL